MASSVIFSKIQAAALLSPRLLNGFLGKRGRADICLKKRRNVFHTLRWINRVSEHQLTSSSTQLPCKCSSFVICRECKETRRKNIPGYLVLYIRYWKLIQFLLLFCLSLLYKVSSASRVSAIALWKHTAFSSTAGPVTQSNIPPRRSLTVERSPDSSLSYIHCSPSTLSPLLSLHLTLQLHRIISAFWGHGVFLLWQGLWHTLSSPWNALSSTALPRAVSFRRKVPESILGEAFPGCVRSSHSFVCSFILLQDSLTYHV